MRQLTVKVPEEDLHFFSKLLDKLGYSYEVNNLTTAELKNILHKLVVETNDTEILKKVKEFIIKISS